jgi:hypothetical protein
MSQIADDIGLARCFREIDRAEVEPPEHARFPLEIDRYFAWTSGPRAFLLFRAAAAEPLRGIVFHRNTSSVPDLVTMCEWCHAVRGHGRVKLLSARSDARRHIGLYLCSDLGCLEKLHEVPGPDDLFDGVDVDVRREQILARIAHFANRRLF